MSYNYILLNSQLIWADVQQEDPVVSNDRRYMKRPITVRLPDYLRDLLDRISESEHVPVSEIVRQAVHRQTQLRLNLAEQAGPENGSHHPAEVKENALKEKFSWL